MELSDLFDLSREAIFMVIKIGAPIMLVGLVIGVIVALFQALTQIQEMTLAFVPKILGVFTALYILLPWIGQVLTEFSQQIADAIIALN